MRLRANNKCHGVTLAGLRPTKAIFKWLPFYVYIIHERCWRIHLDSDMLADSSFRWVAIRTDNKHNHIAHIRYPSQPLFRRVPRCHFTTYWNDHILTRRSIDLFRLIYFHSDAKLWILWDNNRGKPASTICLAQHLFIDILDSLNFA